MVSNFVVVVKKTEENEVSIWDLNNMSISKFRADLR